MWWEKLARNEPMVCVYCAAETSVAEDEEHILPESLGNKQMLYRGAVCNSCNHALGCNVDSKIFNEALVAAYRIGSATKIKRTGSLIVALEISYS